jgi:hypothetical protein
VRRFLPIGCRGGTLETKYKRADLPPSYTDGRRSTQAKPRRLSKLSISTNQYVPWLGRPFCSPIPEVHAIPVSILFPLFFQTYQRPPPAGFPIWYAYTRNHSVHFTNPSSYASLEASLRPFRALSPEFLRSQVREFEKRHPVVDRRTRIFEIWIEDGVCKGRGQEDWPPRVEISRSGWEFCKVGLMIGLPSHLEPELRTDSAKSQLIIIRLCLCLLYIRKSKALSTSSRISPPSSTRLATLVPSCCPTNISRTSPPSV